MHVLWTSHIWQSPEVGPCPILIPNPGAYRDGISLPYTEMDIGQPLLRNKRMRKGENVIATLLTPTLWCNWSKTCVMKWDAGCALTPEFLYWKELSFCPLHSLPVSVHTHLGSWGCTFCLHGRSTQQRGHERDVPPPSLAQGGHLGFQCASSDKSQPSTPLPQKVYYKGNPPQL